jgi:hypothetical protein
MNPADGPGSHILCCVVCSLLVRQQKREVFSTYKILIRAHLSEYSYTADPTFSQGEEICWP